MEQEANEFDPIGVFPEGQLVKMAKKAMAILGIKVIKISLLFSF